MSGIDKKKVLNQVNIVGRDKNTKHVKKVIFPHAIDFGLPSHQEFLNDVKFFNGLTGSLTKLTDGTSYLVAGNNITIASSSNGQVIVSATGGAGGSAPGGSNTQVQFNDGGSSLGGDSNFTFNKNTDSLIVTNLSGSLTHLSDGTSYLIAGNDVVITTSSNGSIVIASSSSLGPAEDTRMVFLLIFLTALL